MARWRVDASRRPAFAISLTSNKMPRPQRQWCWRGKASCLTVACTSCCLKSDIVQAQPRPDQTRPGQAKPDQTKPDQTQPSPAECSPVQPTPGPGRHPPLEFLLVLLPLLLFCYETVHPYKPLTHAHSSASTPPCIRFSYQRRTFLS